MTDRTPVAAAFKVFLQTLATTQGAIRTGAWLSLRSAMVSDKRCKSCYELPDRTGGWFPLPLPTVGAPADFGPSLP